ncbi:MAG: hypothetical protein LQ347_004819 [Umbilicaria vellea]|nr:MAG: hypothetical protein LQ347_004819 [Umbilicaria vellea]
MVEEVRAISEDSPAGVDKLIEELNGPRVSVADLSAVAKVLPIEERELERERDKLVDEDPGPESSTFLPVAEDGTVVPLEILSEALGAAESLLDSEASLAVEEDKSSARDPEEEAGMSAPTDTTPELLTALVAPDAVKVASTDDGLLANDKVLPSLLAVDNVLPVPPTAAEDVMPASTDERLLATDDAALPVPLGEAEGLSVLPLTAVIDPPMLALEPREAEESPVLPLLLRELDRPPLLPTPLAEAMEP